MRAKAHLAATTAGVAVNPIQLVPASTAWLAVAAAVRAVMVVAVADLAAAAEVVAVATVAVMAAADLSVVD